MPAAARSNAATVPRTCLHALQTPAASSRCTRIGTEMSCCYAGECPGTGLAASLSFCGRIVDMLGSSLFFLGHRPFDMSKKPKNSDDANRANKTQHKVTSSVALSPPLPSRSYPSPRSDSTVVSGWRFSPFQSHRRPSQDVQAKGPSGCLPQRPREVQGGSNRPRPSLVWQHPRFAAPLRRTVHCFASPPQSAADPPTAAC